MPIGAAIGGGVLAAGGSIGAGILSSNAQKDAAATASDTSLQTAQMNDQLYRDIYGQNLSLLTPYSNMGLQAGNALNDLLLGTHSFNPSGPTNMGTPLPQGATGGIGTGTPAQPTYTGPSLAQIQAMQHDGIPHNYANALAAYNAAHAGTSTGGALSGFGSTAAQPTSGALTAPVASRTPLAARTAGTVTAAPNTANSAFDQFRNSTNYQFRFNQGQGALQSMLAAHGALDSGAADKSEVTFAQNFASNELANYMNLLAGQQSMGLSAAGAVAGVGTNYAGNVANQNTNAGNVAANAALASGQANAGMYGSIGQGIGQLGGALFQYGMGGMAPAAGAAPGGITIGGGTGGYFAQNPFGGFG
jgi:hypothetical protein